MSVWALGRPFLYSIRCLDRGDFFFFKYDPQIAGLVLRAPGRLRANCLEGTAAESQPAFPEAWRNDRLLGFFLTGRSRDGLTTANKAPRQTDGDTNEPMTPPAHDYLSKIGLGAMFCVKSRTSTVVPTAILLRFHCAICQ